MDDLLKYFHNLFYGFRFKRLKVDDAMHIPEMNADAGNIRLNGKLEVKLAGTWTEVSGEEIIFDNGPVAGSNHGVTSDGVYQAILEEHNERITEDGYVKAELRENVPVIGNTLNKLYNIIISSFTEASVANTAARDATDVKSGDHIFVIDDGDGRWALYKATTAGVNATYVKLSDPDMLNAIMSASQIKASYESNPDTNAFTNALLSKLNALYQPDISGIAANAAAIIAEATARNNEDAAIIANINAETTARANAIAAVQADAIAINNAEYAARTAADTTLQNNINAEAATRNSVDAAIVVNINAETTARTNAVAALAADVIAINNTEAGIRAAADTTLQNNINANSTNISANASGLAAEITNRTNADSAEATTRANADTTNANAITAEVTNRTNAVSAEATARANADANKVDAVSGSSLISNTELTRLSNILAGIPTAGNAGQFLKKTTATNFAVNWANLSVNDISDLGSTYISLSTILIAVHVTSIGVTQNSTTGLTLINDTPALSNAQQYSPAMRWIAQGWKTAATAGSGPVEFRAYVAPVVGSGTPSGSFVIESSVTPGSYLQLFSITQGGVCTIANALNIQQGGITSNGITNITTSDGSIGASVDGVILNSVAANLGAGRTNMFAPSFKWNASALNASNAPQAANFKAEVRPVNGTTPIIASWFLSAQINNTGYTDVLQVTHTGTLITKASTAAAAGFRIVPGAAPTAPVNGDIWADATNIYVRLNGVTKTFTLT